MSGCDLTIDPCNPLELNRASEPASSRRLLQRYTPKYLLGHGANGVVFAVEDKSSGDFNYPNDPNNPNIKTPMTLMTLMSRMTLIILITLITNNPDNPDNPDDPNHPDNPNVPKTLVTLISLMNP